ncbi:MAG: SspB family protein [Alphaproteobacteria bacterium]
MTEDLLRYDQIVERALRGVVRTALEQIADHGLPGNHSLYITLRTDHADVVISDVLRAEHPQEMTIVLENQFWDLEVSEDHFSVTLSFNKKRERLTVPFIAVSAFADPTVQFGLKFEAAGDDEDAGQMADDGQGEGQPAGEKGESAEDPSDPGDASDKVVALDAFRKK